MLGRALMFEGRKRGLSIIGAARTNMDLILDVCQDDELVKQVNELKPDVIINTVAMTNIEQCERDQCLAYRVNTRPAGILAAISNKIDAYFIHISTDHFYSGDGNKKHKIHSPVYLLNEYARTKYGAEYFALIAKNSLVVRTNIVGFKHITCSPTFIEWVINSLITDSPITLFDDFFTSSIHVRQFAKCLFDLIPMHPLGILNLASREVASKKIFIESFANELGYKLSNPRIVSVKQSMVVPRAESLGLDVEAAEAILGYDLPTLSEVVKSLKEEYEEDSNAV